MTDLIRGLPPALLEGSSYAIACDVADELLHLFNAGDLASLYMRIDELDEDILDILAFDFKIDWWDTEYTLEEKRKVMASSWEVHRHLGTVGAVITAIKSLYPDAEISEWYDYSGLPFHFKIRISENDTFIDDDKRRRLFARVEFYKNLRSVFDSLASCVTVQTPAFSGVGLRHFKKTALTLDCTVPVFTDEDGEVLVDEEENQFIDE